MADQEDIGFEHLRTLATEWPRFKEMLAQRDLAVHRLADPALSLMSSASQRRGTWELSLAVAGYSLVERAPDMPSGPAGDFTVIVNRLVTSRDRSLRLPGFSQVASQVATLPFNKLIHHAPLLNSIARDIEPLTVSSLACTAFCLNRYPNDREAFIRCVRECGGHS
jgi:hypothetical protein